MVERDDSTTNRDDAELDALLRAALPEQQPPPGFTESTLARRRRQRRWRPAVAALAAAGLAAAGIAALLLTSRGAVPTSGALVAAARETREVGRATVVAEPGARLAWNIDGAGATRVQLEDGRAFFRVDRGADPFVVETASGRVVVHGTCFTVEIVKEQPMSALAISSRLPAAAAGAVLGAALSAAIVVTVYEGRVSLENPHGQVSVSAGEEARAASDRAPQATGIPDQDALTRTVAALARAEEALQASSAASGGEVGALLAENTRLRHELDARQSEMKVLMAERSEDRGDALPFPDDLPPRFTEGELLKAFTQGFEDVGLKGDVSHIDCTEFPCIVYGKIEGGDTRELMKRLQGSPVFARYADDDRSVAGWAHGEGAPEEFAVALMPKYPDSASKPEGMGRRIGWRIKQGRAR